MAAYSEQPLCNDSTTACQFALVVEIPRPKFLRRPKFGPILEHFSDLNHVTGICRAVDVRLSMSSTKLILFYGTLLVTCSKYN